LSVVERPGVVDRVGLFPLLRVFPVPATHDDVTSKRVVRGRWRQVSLLVGSVETSAAVALASSSRRTSHMNLSSVRLLSITWTVFNQSINQ